MGKNAKLGIVALVVVLLALAAATQGPLIGIGVLVVGGLGLVVLYQRLPDDDGDGGGDGGAAPKKKGKELTGKKRLDALLDSQADGGTTTTAPRPTAAPAGEGLPTWGGGLDTWSPPADEAVAEDTSSNSWDTWDNNWSGDDADTIALDEENPLDNLDQLDDIDPIAEVERLDASEDSISFDEFEEEWSAADDTDEVEVDEPAPAGAFSFGSAPPVINEDVTSADDIMAASHATELDEGATDDSELAKLLAKVQARLAAYE